MIHKFAHTISWPGALSNATYTFAFQVPSDCCLVHVSASQSNATAASTFTIGTSADADGYLTGGVFGASADPAEFDLDDFDGALLTGAGSEYPRLSDGDILKVTITGTAANQATDGMIVLTFVEG